MHLLHTRLRSAFNLAIGTTHTQHRVLEHYANYVILPRVIMCTVRTHTKVKQMTQRGFDTTFSSSFRYPPPPSPPFNFGSIRVGT